MPTRFCVYYILPICSLATPDGPSKIPAKTPLNFINTDLFAVGEGLIDPESCRHYLLSHLKNELIDKRALEYFTSYSL